MKKQKFIVEIRRKKGKPISLSKERREHVKKYLCETIDAKKKDYVKKVCATSNLSTTSVYRYLKELVDDGILEKTDEEIPYRLKNERFDFVFQPSRGKPDEIEMYRVVREKFPEISDAARRCWDYAFTEMANNALEHSNATTIFCSVERNFLNTVVTVADDGVGIFRNIQRFFEEKRGEKIELQDALTILFSGKFTTNDEKHAGEGIFFTSRLTDEFFIFSDDLFFTRNSYDLFSGRVFPFRKDDERKTVVYMKLENRSRKSSKKIFDAFAEENADGEFIFDRTDIPLANMIPDGYPVARSQARRVATNFLKFRKITLDFSGVNDVGQAFAHELFVVFAKENPTITLDYRGANGAVDKMIKRVVATSRRAKPAAENNPPAAR